MSSLDVPLSNLSSAEIRRVERLCDRFEQQWQEGKRPELEEYLDGLTSEERQVALRYLIPLDSEYRRLGGEMIDGGLYQSRFPDLSGSWLADTLGEVTRTTSPLRTPAGTRSEWLGIRQLNGKTLPGYEIIDEIARGGMGIVYKARQVKLNRPVALKMMLLGDSAGPYELQRFRMEAEATAALDHPNIVPIYEVGEWQPTSEGAMVPFVSMRLIEGGSLADILEQGEWERAARADFRRAAKLVATVANAVHYAHQHGILHRDLKPANILIDAQGEPHVTDFGLAKQLSRPADAQPPAGNPTESNILMGTPSYIAPEQLEVGSKGLTTAADVYALGAILYELITGRPPFQGKTPLETLQRAANHEPVSPTKVLSDVPRDLETIVLKCLEKQPHNRYASADDLADDLQRFLEGQPVLARPTSALSKSIKWARRRPALAGMLAALLLVSVVGFAAVTWQWHLATEMQERLALAQARTESALKTAEAQKVEVETSLKKQKTLGLIGGVARVQRSLADNDIGRALQEIEAIPSDMRNFEYAFLQSLAQRRMRILHQHGKRVTQIAASRTSQCVVSGSADGQVAAVFVESGEKVVIDVGKPVRALAITPNGRKLAVAADQLYLYDLPSGRPHQALSEADDSSIVSLAFSADGQQLAAGCATGESNLKIWNLATGKVERAFTPHAGEVRSVAFHPLKGTLASGGSDWTVALWDISVDPPTAVMQHKHGGPVVGVTCTSGGRGLYAVSGGAFPSLRSLDIPNNRLRKSLIVSSWPLTGVASIADFRVIVADTGGTLRVLNTQNFYEEYVFRGHTGAINSVAGDSSAQWLASGGEDGTVRLWSMKSELEARRLADEQGAVTSLAFQSHGEWLAVGGDETVQVLSVENGDRHFTIPSRDASHVAFSRSGQHLAVAGRSSEGGDYPAEGIAIYDLATRRPGPPSDPPPLIRQCPVTEGTIAAMAYCPTTGRIAAAVRRSAERGLLKIVDGYTAEPVLQVELDMHWPVAVAFDSVGAKVAIADKEGGVHVLRTRDWQPLTSLGEERAIVSINDIAFHPYSRSLAVAGEDGSLRLWDTTTGSKLREFEPHKSAIKQIAFSPDGSRLVAGTSDGSLRWWDTATGLSIMSLAGDSQGVAAVAFSSDGRRVASGSHSGSVKLWEALEVVPPASQ